MKVNDVLVEAKKEKLELKPLKFKETELAPIMSKETIALHYGKLTKAYFEKYEKTGDLFQKAGAVLHNQWWEQLMPPKKNNKPTGKVLELIESKFKTFKDFQEEWKTTAIGIHGSGWVWLSTKGVMKVIPNHKIEKGILLIIDSWEHSWVPDHLDGDKAKYYDDIWQLIDWEFINSRLD